MSRFSDEQVRRYSRQILLVDVGGRGQARLLAAEVAIEIDGAAGRIAALLLAAAGVGRIALCGAVDRRLAEHDVGFPLTRADVGRALGDAMAAHVAARNPDVAVTTSATVPAHALRVEAPASAPRVEASARRVDGERSAAAAFARAGAAATRVAHALATGAVMPAIAPAAWSAVIGACEAAWPREACGWLSGAAAVATDVHPATMGTRDALAFADDDLAALADAYLAGPAPRALYHAHPQGPATLSDADLAGLAPGGVVLHPLPHLVVAVRDRRATAATLYRWRDGAPYVVAAAVRADDDRWHLREVGP